MDNLIRVYDDALSIKKCKYLVDMFERYPELHEHQVNADGQTLTRINLMAYKRISNPFSEDLEYLSNVFMRAARKYKDDLGVQQFQFPPKFALEAMKIKRYQPGGQDSFPAHVDVTNLENCKRFLVMFIYLTDNQRGQTTLNVKDDLFVSSCKRGSILLFPPYWPWVHSGEKPLQDSKYILGSYLHYAE
jgi:hypothetical protein